MGKFVAHLSLAVLIATGAEAQAIPLMDMPGADTAQPDEPANSSVSSNGTANDLKNETAQVALDQAKANLTATQITNETNLQALRTAKANAFATAIPASSTTGAATAGENAGQIEATILSAQALRALGSLIAAEIKEATTTKAEYIGEPGAAFGCSLFSDPISPGAIPPPASPDKARVALFAGSTKVDTTLYALFRFKACALNKQFADAQKDLPHSSRVRPESASLVGGAISAAVKLIQLIVPDWTLGNVSVTFDDRALAAATAHAYLETEGHSPLIWPDRATKLRGSDRVFFVINQLDLANIELQKGATLIAANLEAAKKKLSDDKDTKADTSADQAAVDKLTKISNELTAVTSAYAAFITSMDASSTAAAMPINKVVEQAALTETLGDNGLIVTVAVDKAGGGIASRKVLWNVFGGMPYFVSGGAVVDYAVVRPSDQQVIKAGLLTCDAGLTNLRKVSDRVNGKAPSNLNCNSAD